MTTNRSMALLDRGRRKKAEKYEGVEKSKEKRLLKNRIENEKAMQRESEHYGRK